MGSENLNNCAVREDVVVTAACDVWKERLDKVITKYPNSKGYTDYSELLRHQGLDAVIIASPAHWHALQAIEAAKAGLHIYLQKPMTMHLAESLAVRNAVRKHKVICQIGTQIHSNDHYRRMVELVRSGNLGDIATVRTFFVMNAAPEGIGSGNNNSPIPDGLNWDKWVGPALMQPFNPNIVRDSFYHCFWQNFSGGWTPGMAPHITDLPIWAMELGYPTEISAMGGKYVLKDDSDAYDNQEIIWRYPNMTMTWMFSSTNSHGWAFQNSDRSGLGYETGTRRRLGIYFHGSNATLMTDYSSHILVPEGDKLEGKPTPPPTLPASPGQEQEWLNSIKSGIPPLCNPEYHVKVDVPIVLSLLSMQIGRSIRFDPKTEKIVDDKEATRLSIPKYRPPYKFPSEYL
jgi:predicted dehydrogenase